MEHIPARHAAKVGMRYPARVLDTGLIGLSLQLDLSGLAPGRSPVLNANLFFGQSIGTNYARTLEIGQRIEVVLIDVTATVGLVASLPANPKWLAWNNGTVRHLARRIRETGETVLIPVLGDALEDAGCTDAIVLEQLRQDPAPRSWVVELLATQE